MPGLFALGESAVLEVFGSGVSARLIERVQSAATLLREAVRPGVMEIVPAYNSVLVSFEPDRADEAALESAIYDAASAAARPASRAASHIVPVRYGEDAGPDLSEVASRIGLSPREVVGLHSRQAYRVAFIGFLPGFPYMYETLADISTPRHATPRVSVPAGSVGIAARQTGIYPFASPGGWQILGQTTLPLWDPQAEQPAMFAPGDVVRFVASEERRVEAQPPRVPISRRPVFKVVEAGALTTVQDLGRRGYAHLGVGPSGAFDTEAALRANSLVGNRGDAAVLEMTLLGPVLKALTSTTLAVTGADFGCHVDGVPLPRGISWFVRAGSIIRFSAATRGVRGCVAVAGGVDVTPVLGSRSTSAYGGFGGYGGRPLRAGDLLGLAAPPPEPSSLAGRIGAEPQQDAPGGTYEVRYVPFDGPQFAGKSQRQGLERGEWMVSERSDRMGLRLTGEDPVAGAGGELASFPVVQGTIQLPPDGRPIVLGPDHQTTGGYPILGVVAARDRSVLAQAAPGTRLRFTPVTREEARALART